jgi:hypothetical protein
VNRNRLIWCLCLVGLLTFAEPLRAAAAPAPAPLAPTGDVEQDGLPTGRYIAGGIVGTAVGFGIGHGIQQRYFPLGLVFSIGEAAGLVLYLSNVSVTTTTNSSGFPTTSSVNIGTVGAIGLATILGFHIWETVDIWVTGTALHRKWVERHPRASLSILPAVMVRGTTSPGLTVALTF